MLCFGKSIFDLNLNALLNYIPAEYKSRQAEISTCNHSVFVIEGDNNGGVEFSVFHCREFSAMIH